MTYAGTKSRHFFYFHRIAMQRAVRLFALVIPYRSNSRSHLNDSGKPQRLRFSVAALSSDVTIFC
jgi:hypothetical protein